MVFKRVFEREREREGKAGRKKEVGQGRRSGGGNAHCSINFRRKNVALERTLLCRNCVKF